LNGENRDESQLKMVSIFSATQIQLQCANERVGHYFASTANSQD